MDCHDQHLHYSPLKCKTTKEIRTEYEAKRVGDRMKSDHFERNVREFWELFTFHYWKKCTGEVDILQVQSTQGNNFSEEGNENL